MTKHQALIPLAHDHHHFLAHARRMQEAAASGDEAARRRAADDFVSFYLGKVLRNMREEQELFFPAAFFGDERARPLVLKAFGGHLELYHKTHQLQAELSTGKISAEMLEVVAEILAEHVRLEEKELFPVLETAIGDEELQRLGSSGRRDV